MHTIHSCDVWQSFISPAFEFLYLFFSNVRWGLFKYPFILYLLRCHVTSKYLLYILFISISSALPVVWSENPGMHGNTKSTVVYCFPSNGSRTSAFRTTSTSSLKLSLFRKWTSSPGLLRFFSITERKILHPQIISFFTPVNRLLVLPHPQSLDLSAFEGKYVTTDAFNIAYVVRLMLCIGSNGCQKVQWGNYTPHLEKIMFKYRLPLIQRQLAQLLLLPETHFNVMPLFILLVANFTISLLCCSLACLVSLSLPLFSRELTPKVFRAFQALYTPFLHIGLAFHTRSFILLRDVKSVGQHNREPALFLTPSSFTLDLNFQLQELTSKYSS